MTYGIYGSHSKHASNMGPWSHAQPRGTCGGYWSGGFPGGTGGNPVQFNSQFNALIMQLLGALGGGQSGGGGYGGGVPHGYGFPGGWNIFAGNSIGNTTPAPAPSMPAGFFGGYSRGGSS